jgi:hypothetical protein
MLKFSSDSIKFEKFSIMAAPHAVLGKDYTEKAVICTYFLYFVPLNLCIWKLLGWTS